MTSAHALKRVAFQLCVPLTARRRRSCAIGVRPIRSACIRSSPHRRAVLLARQQLDPQGREYIRLDGFLKLQGLADTGGQAKVLIQEGEVYVNGQVETRRGKKLLQGDVVSMAHDSMEVDFSADPAE